jgi:hypothetical protein
MYREAAIQDMMGTPPGWLLHSGLSAIAVVVAVVLGLTAFIRYPEKVEAPFLLQTEKIPLALHAGAVGVIETVYTPSEASVTAGDTLLIFRSETDWRPVRDLDLWLAQLEQDLYAQSSTALTSSSAELVASKLQYLSRLPHLQHLPSPQERGRGRGNYSATIQAPFTTLKTILRARTSYQKTNGVAAEVRAYEREIEDAKRLSTSLNKQVALYERELTYQQKQTDRMTELEQSGIVSTQEMEEATAQTIGARRQREVLVSSDIQNQLRVQQVRQQILQRKLTHSEKLADFDRQVLTQLKLMRSAFDEYRERYVLTVREDGKLNWQPTVRAQATVSPTNPLGYLINPNGSDEMIARLQLPTLGQGKITVGDKVILDFAAYPSREYGQVEGKLTSVAPVALPDQNNEYFRLATVALPDSLTTSYGKTLPFQYNLSGTARIITAERTLLQRLLDQFLNLTQNT